MNDERRYVMRRNDGRYFHRLLGWQSKQTKASRFVGRDYARMCLARIKNAVPVRLIRLVPRKARG